MNEPKIPITYIGRAYPTPDLARERMRQVLTQAGIDIPFDDIHAVMETPGAICPWGAKAWVPADVWRAYQLTTPSE